jgi:hypothetical protein
MLGGMSEVAELVVIKTHLSRGLGSNA